MIEYLFTTTLLIAAVCVLRALTENTVSRRLQYALWLVVAVRLLVPFSFPSTVSVANVLPSTVQASKIPLQLPLFTPAAPPTVEEPIASVMSVSDVLRAIWLVGSIVIFLWFVGVNLVLSHRLKTHRTRLVCDCPLPVYVTQNTAAPCLNGLFCPCIYLSPSVAQDEETRACVLAHEEAHFRQGDLVWAWVRLVTLSVWWFFPPVWVAAILSKRDCEAACDERAIQVLGDEKRAVYANTLILVAAQKPSLKTVSTAATTMSATRKTMKGRIHMIVHQHKHHLVTALVVILVLALAVGCTFTGATSSEQQSAYSMEFAQFDLNITLPDGWTMGEAQAMPVPFLGQTVASGIYNENGDYVGGLGYNTYQEYEGAEEVPQAIYSAIALANHCQFSAQPQENGGDYREVKDNGNGKTAVTSVYYSAMFCEQYGYTPNEENCHKNHGILCYNKDKLVFVALEFDSRVVDVATVEEIAQSIVVA